MRDMGRIGLIWLLAMACACSGGGRAQEDGAEDSIEIVELDSIQALHDISADARMWADSIMDTMTVEEMAGQLIMPAVYSDDSREAMKLLYRYAADSHIGGVVLLKGSTEAAKTIADTLRTLLPAPPFIAIDAEWGLAMRLEGTPEFPRNGRITESADQSVLFDYGSEMADEGCVLGMNMVNGIVMDVLPDGRRRLDIWSRCFGRENRRLDDLGVP